MSNAVRAAWITAAAVLVAAVIGAILQPSWWRHDVATAPTLTSSPSFTIAGTVVDQTSNQGVGQALVSIEGRAETDVTEDNGNFRIDLRGDLPSDDRVRIHITKDGYLPLDQSTRSSERLTVLLKRK